MTPAKMFTEFGSNERVRFDAGDKVKTPAGIASIEYEFIRGLKWWCKTSLGTFQSTTINELNIVPA